MTWRNGKLRASVTIAQNCYFLSIVEFDLSADGQLAVR